ncbi:hypothetical protein NC651_038616 [Populus alba x Populus x berolinensis]|nr:hypothetical protein NC651_038616 [Populus alba x Populus x berolinensis]
MTSSVSLSNSNICARNNWNTLKISSESFKSDCRNPHTPDQNSSVFFPSPRTLPPLPPVPWYARSKMESNCISIS